MTFKPRLRSLVATLEFLKGPSDTPECFVTMEAIAFQTNDKFGAELEEVVTMYKDMIDSGAKQKALNSAVDLRAKIESIVQRRLGMKIKLIINDSLAAIIPNVYVPHSPMIQDPYRDMYEYYLSEKDFNPLLKAKNKQSLGTVNVGTAKVTGWFSEQECPVFINFLALFNDFEMTVPEVVAIILHELGHGFKAILFSSNINTSNQILADVARHIESKPKNADVNYIYSKLKAIDKTATLDMAEAMASGNKVVMNVTAYRLINGITQSLMSDSTYNKTTFEALADNFSTRFGYGSQLVTGLEKMEEEYSDFEHNRYLYESSIQAMLYFGIYSIILSVCGIVLLVSGSVPGGLFVSFLGLVFGWVTTLVFKSNRVTHKDMTYDDIKTRYMRIRNTLVEYIKLEDVPPATQKSLLEQIKAIDAIIAEKPAFENLITKLGIKLFSSDRQAQQSIIQQQQLEKMIANELFLSSARLSLLGGKQ